ncbi:MAG: DMT family transporter [Muribaculaceae bacterium]|nr:DMT family transporter [Muribaculaceae bacterium]MDE5929740.1 DMT family transporter [Muribaculaceae bacterium]
MKSVKSTAHSRKSLILGHLGAVLTVSIWGASFVSTKVLLENRLSPSEIYILRFVLAYLLVFAISHARLWARSVRDELLFATCGLCAGSIYFLAENTALEYTLTTNVALLTATSPLFTAMLAGMIYKSERPGRGAIVGSLVAFLGVGCVIFNSSTNLEVRPFGDILSLLAAISWSVYSLVLRRLNATYDIWFITRKTFFYGVLTALPFAFFQPTSDNLWATLAKPEVIGNLLFLGVGASMLAYVIWARTVERMGAVKANNYMYLQPIITMIISAIVINEHVTLIGYLGIALILGGLWLGDKLSKKAE